jgi:type I restriction enzyme S subunit
MRRYEDYKNTDIQWVRIVPSHWELWRNKNVFIESKDEVGNDHSSYTLLSLTLNGIVPRDIDNPKGKFPASFDKYKIVKKGDMAFCLFDIDETPRTVGLSAFDGMLTGAYNIMHVHNINSRFVYYFYLSIDKVKGLKPLYTGLRKTIKIESFMSTKLPVPPREEQDQIVRYLDWKVSEINRLIRICSEQLALLQEARKKVIADTLKSANDTRQIPLKRLLMKNLTGSWGSDNAEDKKQCICLRVADMDFMSGQFVNTKPEQLTHRYYTQKEIDELTLQKGDILVEKSGGGDKTPVGRTVIFDKPYKALFANFLQCLRIDERVIGPKYALLNLHLLHFTGDIRRIIKQTTGIQNLDMNALLSIKLDVPNLNNQKKILSQIDNQLKKIDELTDKKHEKVDLLHELKSRLISDVVTGQIDVRDVKVPDFEYIEEEFDEDLDEDPADSDFENEED